jgi:hypothetical protein
VPLLDPVRVDIEPLELVALPRTESGLPVVDRDDTDTGSVRPEPVVATTDSAGPAATATGVALAGAAAGAMPHRSQKPS